ncbi:hypothetical protein [Liquorilactobacillus oeni]|uniref:Uncharacterized protein n=1 Tax=Liquorilactobacillus oeni DSM 19972 TaxID=1423777 RepID=A0A0R1MG40_9LACO|nr:hypothetical protein [Liquorilactobacillus oeni]KRL06617.1 hypothetical protein FD46_GL000289 [Liquorilactobacillus oeni DSM 19972]
MEIKEQSSKKRILFILIAGSVFIIQLLLILSFRSRLGTRLPTYFAPNGFVIYWFNYSRPIIVPGILFLAVFHLGGFLLARYIPIILKSIPLVFNFLEDTKYIGYILFSWIEFLSWSVLGYFFLYDSKTIYLMLAINCIHLLLLAIGTIYYKAKN